MALPRNGRARWLIVDPANPVGCRRGEGRGALANPKNSAYVDGTLHTNTNHAYADLLLVSHQADLEDVSAVHGKEILGMVCRNGGGCLTVHWASSGQS